jgi:DNA-binding GntR family transcriptional regulator
MLPRRPAALGLVLSDTRVIVSVADALSVPAALHPGKYAERPEAPVRAARSTALCVGGLGRLRYAIAVSLGPRHQLTTGPSLADQAYNVLRDLIASGELAPAERLTERALAARLGVSPTPIREAISRLIHERLLVRVDGRTLQVAAPSLRRLREMSLIQAALQGVAGRLAAESATEAELEAIARVHLGSQRRPKRASKPATREDPAELRHDFHQLIVEASHSPSLIDMIATAEAFSRALRLQAQRAAGAAEAIRQAVHEHDAILGALQARDGDRAEALLREHTAWVNERYLQWAEQHGVAQAAPA